MLFLSCKYLVISILFIPFLLFFWDHAFSRLGWVWDIMLGRGIGIREMQSWYYSCLSFGWRVYEMWVILARLSNWFVIGIYVEKIWKLSFSYLIVWLIYHLVMIAPLEPHELCVSKSYFKINFQVYEVIVELVIWDNKQ